MPFRLSETNLMCENVEDPVLGHLSWDDEFHWWRATINLHPGHQIEVIVDYDIEFNEAIDAQGTRMAQAREWIARVRQREPEYRMWTAEQLLGGRWNLDEPMTVEDIRQLLHPLSIECESDSSARVYWDDDDVLYYGHGFYTQLGAGGECIEVRLQ
jgi:hypothetical protein